MKFWKRCKRWSGSWGKRPLNYKNRQAREDIERLFSGLRVLCGYIGCVLTVLFVRELEHLVVGMHFLNDFHAHIVAGLGFIDILMFDLQ